MRKDITRYIETCVECHKFKPSNTAGAHEALSPRIPERFEILSIDLVGPLPETAQGHIYLPTIMDIASSYFEMFSMPKATAEAISKILTEEIFLRYGFPKALRCDNGTQFISTVIKQLAQSMNIQLQWVANYLPRANPVERKHRDLKQKIAMAVMDLHLTWDLHIPAIRWSMNSTPSSVMAFSPILLTFGREPRQPRDYIRFQRLLL